MKEHQRELLEKSKMLINKMDPNHWPSFFTFKRLKYTRITLKVAILTMVLTSSLSWLLKIIITSLFILYEITTMILSTGVGIISERANKIADDNEELSKFISDANKDGHRYPKA